MRKLLSVLLGTALALPLALATSPVLAQETCPAPSPVPLPSPSEAVLMPEDARIALFDTVWSAIDQAYLDPTFNGVDWEAVGDEYAPQFLRLENAWEVYDLAAQMVAELGDEDNQVVSPYIIDALPPVPEGYVGIGTAVDALTSEAPGEGPRILYVFPGSGAEAAGLQPRDRIVSVDGDPCVSVAAIRGPEGSTVSLGIVTPGEPEREVVVERRAIVPTIEPIAKRIGDALYVRLAAMEGEDLLAATESVARDLLGDGTPTGFILDLRSVDGGATAFTIALLSALLDGNAGAFYSRNDRTPIELVESDLRAALADLPVAVLVDPFSAGEPERLAAILQAAGRAVVVGTPTTGRTRGAQELELPGGGLLQIVTVGLELPDGTRLDGSGITPDVPVDEDWLAYPEADDPFILAALDALRAAGGPGASPAAGAGSPAPASEAPSPGS